MSDEQLSALIGRPVVERTRRRAARLQPSLGRSGHVRRPRHDSGGGDRRAVASAGSKQDVPVAFNRLLSSTTTCSSAGRSFRTRSSASPAARSTCFPASRRPRSSTSRIGWARSSRATDVLGTIDTPVRAVIDRAASLLQTPLSLLALVVTHEGVAGVFCGEASGDHAAWRRGRRAVGTSPRRLARSAVRSRARR